MSNPLPVEALLSDDQRRGLDEKAAAPAKETAAKNAERDQSTDSSERLQEVFDRIEIDPQSMRSFCRCLAKEMIVAYAAFREYCEFYHAQGTSPGEYLASFLKSERGDD